MVSSSMEMINVMVSVQVLIRIRPLSTRERVSEGYGRCLRQESLQTVVWLGHPETRFTFDHIACETISQVHVLGFLLLCIHLKKSSM